MRNIAKFIVAASLAVLSTPASAGFIVTYEAAGVTNSTAGFDYFGIETFDGKVGQTHFTSTFNHDGVQIDLEYKDVVVIPADQFGGAGGSDYGVAGLNSPNRTYTIDISTSVDGAPGNGVNYFGYWLSALDGQNFVSFYKEGVKVFEYAPTDVQALLAGKPEFWGHPVTGENPGEPYVFLNFFAQDGATFDRVVFKQGPGTAGYESDNHTLGFYNRTSGTPIPEPAAIGLIGVGLLGIAGLRRRRA